VRRCAPSYAAKRAELQLGRLYKQGSKKVFLVSTGRGEVNNTALDTENQGDPKNYSRPKVKMGAGNRKAGFEGKKTGK